MSLSIYELDSHVLELLNLDNFLGGLSVNEFIEELSKDHFLKGAEVNELAYLDPKPYIRTFESTLRELKQLKKHAESKMVEIEREVQDYELKHSKNIVSLFSEVDEVTRQFEGLDDKISSVSTKINPLGKSLTKITNSRDKSNGIIFLIRAYHGFFTKEKYDPLNELHKSNNYEDRLKCARLVNNLLGLSKKIASTDLPRTEHCVTVIEKFCETMERDLLSNFDAYYESDEYESMREVANILFEFNGGSNVIQLFLNKHDLISEAGIPEETPLLENEAAWIRISDPNYSGEIRDEATEASLNKLKMSVKAQARIVQQVFENPTPVLKIFIQRLYAQIIQNNVSSLLQYLLSFNSLAHVRILYALYVLLGDFTKDIKEFLAANDLDKNNELSVILDQSNYDLFIEYVSDEVYFTREKKNLEDTIYSMVQEYNTSYEKIITARALATRIENMDNIGYFSKGAESNDRFSYHFSDSKRLSQFKGFMKSHIRERSSRISIGSEKQEDTSEHFMLSVGQVETIFKSVVESVSRVLELAPNRAPEYALEILEIVIFDFGKLYISAGLEVAYDLMRQESYKSSSSQLIDFTYLKAFSTVSQILYLSSACIKKVILPCATNSPTIKSRMTNLSNSYISRCEISLNIIIDDTVKIFLNRISYLLGKQKKRDFVCENIIEDDTEACEEVSEFMATTYANLRNNFNGANLNNILMDVGNSVLNQLLEHYKKFPVNSTGGIVLTRDVIRYQSVIDEWKIPELSENYQILKEIGNLFTVRPNLINSLVTEGRLANLKPTSIRQYISKRTDFNPSYLERFFKFR